MHGRTLRKVEQFYKVSTPCLDDHQFKKEELETVGELSKVCSQIVLECLYLSRIGRLGILWSVNNLEQFIIWVIQHSIVDWDCSKNETLLGT